MKKRRKIIALKLVTAQITINILFSILMIGFNAYQELCESIGMYIICMITCNICMGFCLNMIFEEQERRRESSRLVDKFLVVERKVEPRYRVSYTKNAKFFAEISNVSREQVEIKVLTVQGKEIFQVLPKEEFFTFYDFTDVDLDKEDA